MPKWGVVVSLPFFYLFNFLVFFTSARMCPFYFFFFFGEGGGWFGEWEFVGWGGGFSFICGDFSCKIEFCWATVDLLVMTLKSICKETIHMDRNLDWRDANPSIISFWIALASRRLLIWFTVTFVPFSQWKFTSMMKPSWPSMVLYRYAFRFVLLFYSGFKGARQFQVTML